MWSHYHTSGYQLPLNAYIEEIETAISADLKRDLSISRVEARVFPSLVFRLEELKIDELVNIKSIDLEFNTFRALLSLGETLELDEATVNNAHISLIKGADQRWNFASLPTAEEDSRPEEVVESSPSSR